MKKLVPVVIFLVILAGAAALAFFYFNQATGSQFGSSSTEVVVFEGAVEVWKVGKNGARIVLDSKGNPINIDANADGLFLDEHGNKITSKMVHADEKFVVEGQRLKKLGSFFADHIQPVMLSETINGVSALRDIAKNYPASFSHLYTEDELNEGVLKRVSARMSVVKNLSVVVTPKGMKIYGQAKIAGLQLDGSCSALIQVDEAGELYLKLRWVKFGPFALPEFLLREMEDVFRESVHRADLPMKILKVEYQQGGILLVCRKEGELAGKTNYV